MTNCFYLNRNNIMHNDNDSFWSCKNEILINAQHICWCRGCTSISCDIAEFPQCFVCVAPALEMLNKCKCNGDSRACCIHLSCSARGRQRSCPTQKRCTWHQSLHMQQGFASIATAAAATGAGAATGLAPTGGIR